MKTKVAVVIDVDDSGERDVLFYDVNCTQDDFDLGLHHDMAEKMAVEDGYLVKDTYDEKEPVFHKFKNSLKNKSSNDQNKKNNEHNNFHF